MALKAFFKVNVDMINSLALSPNFLLGEVHRLQVNADISSLPASILPLFSNVSWFDFFQPFINNIVVDTCYLARLVVVGLAFYLCLHLCEATKWCSVHHYSLSTCIFCQNSIYPYFHNLELTVRHRFGEFIWAFVRTCALILIQTHCDIFFDLLIGEISSQTA